jgi:hypothetical protein
MCDVFKQNICSFQNSTPLHQTNRFRVASLSNHTSHKETISVNVPHQYVIKNESMVKILSDGMVQFKYAYNSRKHPKHIALTTNVCLIFRIFCAPCLIFQMFCDLAVNF